MGSKDGCSEIHSQVEIKEGKNFHIQKALEVRRWWGDKIHRWWKEEMVGCLQTWILSEGMHGYIHGLRRIWPRGSTGSLRDEELKVFFFFLMRQERTNKCDGEITAPVYKRNCCVSSFWNSSCPFLFSIWFTQCFA